MSASCCAGCMPLLLARTPDGWVQRSSFSHSDLHEELVQDFVSSADPFSSVASSSVVAFQFLLLGDQNAGKSTFLHAFTHAGTLSWLQLNSILPILTSSFVNAQLATEVMRGTAAMDEPPFIDTDVARATLLLTLEDFAFFVDEFSLPISREALERLAAEHVRYATIELVEIGGDHLDRMQSQADGERDDRCSGPHQARLRFSSALELALRRSEQLVGTSQTTIYFLNARSLLVAGVEDGSHQRLLLDADAVLALAHRMRYLASLLPCGQRVLFYLTRVPEPNGATALFDQDSVRAIVAAINHRRLAAVRGPSLPPLLDEALLLSRAEERQHALLLSAREDPRSELHPEMADVLAPPPPAVALLCALLPELLDALLGTTPPVHTPPVHAPPVHSPPVHSDEGQNAKGRNVVSAKLRFESAVLTQHVVSSSSASRDAGGGAVVPVAPEPLPLINAHAIIGTLTRLFDRDSLRRPPPPAAATAMMVSAQHLLSCFRDVESRLTDEAQGATGTAGTSEADVLNGLGSKRKRGPAASAVPAGGVSFEPWVTRASWEGYLESRHDRLELPANSLADCLPPLAAALSAASLALTHHANGHAAIRILAELQGDRQRRVPPIQRTWQPVAHAADADMGFGVRFPFFAPLLEAIEAPLVRGLPAQWWFELTDANAGVALDVSAVREAEQGLRARLQSQLLLHVRADNAASWDVFVWLLEDWCLACSLLRRLEAPQSPATAVAAAAAAVGEDAFRLVLRAPEVVSRQGLLGFLSMPPKVDTAAVRDGADERWHTVRLVIEEDFDEDYGADMCLPCGHTQ